MADIGADITEVRIASFPLAAQGTTPPARAMLTDPDAMWTDSTAALIQMEKAPSGKTAALARAALWAEADGWDGADGPRMELALVGSAAGDGKEVTSEKVAERRLLIPVNEQVGDSTEMDKLTAHLFRGQYRIGSRLYPRRVAIGFRRETLSESRFLLGARYQAGLDRRWRGNATRSKFKLRMISEWGWAVEQNIVAGGTASGQLSGLGEIVYGFFWTAAPIGSTTITIDGTAHTITWPSGLPTNSYFCPSPPFRFAPSGITASPVLPLYLRPDTPSIQFPAGMSMFWYRNHARI